MKNTNRKIAKVSRKQMKELGWTREQKLDYYCNLNNTVTIAEKNRKLGTQICGLSLPPITTCRSNAPCKSTCYACKGNQQYSSVLGSYMKNLRIWKENPRHFFECIDYYLKYSGYRYMRLFDSGDFPNKQFLIDLIELVIKKNPNVKFMAFTKKYEMINDYLKDHTLPENLNIIFSAWDKNWHFDNPYNLPIAYVNFKNKTLNTNIPTDAKTCDGNCSICYKCWHLEKGESVVFGQH